MALVRLASVISIAAFAAACTTSGAVPRPFPGGPGTPAAEGAPGPEGAPPVEIVPAPETVLFDARRVVETALSFRGVPYRNGGSDPAGFDCSGLVQYVFSQHGIALPRETREQFAFGEDVRLAGIAPGDLLFFRTSGAGPSHVGLAIGGDEFVHAPTSGGVVRVERFSASYWAGRIVGVRRLSQP
jgi:hypothetical protein